MRRGLLRTGSARVYGPVQQAVAKPCAAAQRARAVWHARTRRGAHQAVHCRWRRAGALVEPNPTRRWLCGAKHPRAQGRAPQPSRNAPHCSAASAHLTLRSVAWPSRHAAAWNGAVSRRRGGATRQRSVRIACCLLGAFRNATRTATRAARQRATNWAGSAREQCRRTRSVFRGLPPRPMSQRAGTPARRLSENSPRVFSAAREFMPTRARDGNYE